jgi:hypothetical protein
MEWVRAHPYASAIAAACVLVIGGVILIVNRSSTPTPTGVSAWSGNAGATAPSVPVSASANTQADEAAANAENYGTQTLPYTPPSSGSGVAINTDDSGSSFDYNAFLAQLSQSSSTQASSSASENTGINSNAWTYIPDGLISTSSPSASSRTPIQQALYTYGNEVGSDIQGYNDTHQEQVQAMEDALNDRQNATKAQDAASIGTDMETVGTGIAEIGDVPTEALVDNTALANAYTDSGKKLIAVAQALPGDDADLVTAIETYDTSINTYITDYVALANLFKAYNVTFAPSDPGSVFTFSSSSL